MKQMLVQGRGGVLKTAIMQDGRLLEYDMERSDSDGELVGSLFKGRVVNVLPGMQAAFVDIGQAKNAFLYIDDCLHPHLERQPKEKPSITDLLRPSQSVIVQVVKEPLGTKGARVTTHYSLPGRYLVYMPNADYVGVSKKVNGEQERARLRAIAESGRRPGEGVIVRTAAEGEAADALEADLDRLRGLWTAIERRAETASAPSELHREEGLIHRLVRDMLSAEIDEVWIDDKKRYAETEQLVRRMAPALLPRIRLYDPAASAGLFERYKADKQLDEAFERRIPLSCGGDLVWDQTEALTVIDVNTGKFVGTRDLEDTVFRTNMEAAEQIARLLRLRDVGGIIIIDFIDMDLEEHRAQIARRMEELLRSDRSKTQVAGWTKLGLLELTRRKVRDQALRERRVICPACQGRGSV
ncbi:Rne/Rng family ribonuclease [Paenibacillus humicola]|uniref:Rne/Rng family ribonuclease n=1 Tax=Paenibacillus humicola TaxID=3110540 RepID=UPI00237A2569|nr:Rne/Rng family ribonuclease [Paenibacillus humicola]